MIVEETKANNFSLQFTSETEATQLFNQLSASDDEKLQELGHKLAHRMGTQFAHDDIACTTVLYHTEIGGVLINLLNAVTQINDTKQTPQATNPSEKEPKHKSVLGWFKK